jgi:hypothetical protein
VHVQLPPSKYNNDFAKTFENWWQSPKVTGIIVAVVVLIGFGLYTNHKREQNKLEIVNVTEITKRQGITAEAENVSKHLENESTFVEGTVENQNKYIDESAKIANRDLDIAEQEQKYRVDADSQSLEMQQQQLNDQHQQATLARQQQEKEVAVSQSQQQIELQRQQNFNRLVADHRYREAADYAKTPDEISRLDRLVQAEEKAQVDKSNTAECRQAKTEYEMAAFRNDDAKQVIAKRELWAAACGAQLPDEVIVNTNVNAYGRDRFPIQHPGGTLPAGTQGGGRVGDCQGSLPCPGAPRRTPEASLGPGRTGR